MKTIFTCIFSLFSLFLIAQENGGPYTPDENTVLLMHFDGDATNSADVGNNGIEHGSGVSYESGIHGQALRLDNSTGDIQSWIEVPFFDELNVSSDGIAVECWFKLNSFNSNEGGTKSLFRKDGESWKADYEVMLWPAGNEGRHGQVNLDCVDEESRDWGADAPIADILELNTWYYIVIYYNPNFKHEYVNEEAEQRQASSVYCLIRDENFEEIFGSRGHTETPPTNSEGLFRIGFGGGSESYFDGWIDELRISNKYRKYRDDVLANVDTNAFPDSVFISLKDKWTSGGWPLGELYPRDDETGEIYRENTCGPTMLARAIHYWEHPRFPSGVIQHNMNGYDWYADLDNTEYLWDLIPDNFPSDVTVEEYTPAATFAMHVGTASRESYDYMPCYPEFLINHFHYSPKTRILHREDYTKEEWINILKNELNNGRPVVAGGVIEETLYTGQGAAGHYYVIDGYNKNDEFHTDYSLAGNVWDDPDNFDYGYGMSIIAFMEPDWNNKTLEIISPTENSHLKTSLETEIKWKSSNVNQVKIEYSDNAGKTWNVITESTNASNSYNWTVPNLSSKNYKIRISDNENLNVSQRTSIFEVFEEKQFEFKTPGPGAIISGGIEQPIYWEATGVSAFQLEYSTDNGATWIIIQDSVNILGNISFTFPKVDKEDCLLKATELSDYESRFLSENFNISTQSNNIFLNTDDEGTELLMHFENNLDNTANNGMYAVEGITIGEYVDNYELNLGKAYQFDNGPGLSPMGHYLWIYNSNNLDLGNNWTMESWVNIQSIGDNKTGYFPVIIAKEGVCGITVDHGLAGFHAYLNFNNGSEMTFFQNQSIDLKKWYHVSLISDSASQTINFYIHDKSRNLIYESYQPFPEGSNGLLKQNQNPLVIGGNAYGNMFFDGYLDEVRLTNKSNLLDYIETVELPFFDDFEEEYKYWQTYNKTGFDWWHISGDDGTDGSKCARFSTSMETPYEVNDDWLLTKRLSTAGFSKINISFKYWYYGDGIVPEIVYSPNYVSNIEQAEWIQLDNSNWGEAWTWSTATFEIENPGENITLAIRYQSDEGYASYLLIDDFSIEGTITNSKKIKSPEIDFSIYPNPATSESIISFQTQTSGNVNFSVFDIQGRKICTLLNEKRNAGLHKIPISNSLPASRVYFCKLQTSDGILTKKLIVNAK